MIFAYEIPMHIATYLQKSPFRKFYTGDEVKLSDIIYYIKDDDLAEISFIFGKREAFRNALAKQIYDNLSSDNTIFTNLSKEALERIKTINFNGLPGGISQNIIDKEKHYTVKLLLSILFMSDLKFHNELIEAISEDIVHYEQKSLFKKELLKKLRLELI